MLITISILDSRTMQSKKKRYSQKPRLQWTLDPRFKDWIECTVAIGPGSKRKHSIRCKYCNCSIVSKLSNLIVHMATKKHTDATSILSSSNQSHILFARQKCNREVSRAEGRLALLVAKHTSINVVDHVTDTIKECFGGSSNVASSIQLGRSKCSAIIKNVWHPQFKKMLRNDVHGAYSLIVDESTDVGDQKYLGIVLKYFSVSRKTVLGSFLKLQPLEGGDATSIVNGIKTVLGEFGLDIQNCVGIGTDNASVMVSRENGVYGKLKREIKHLVLVPCVCHSLQLAISEACKKFLPAKLEFLVAETFCWFSRSTARQQQYKRIFNLINEGRNPKKIVRACQTRWLSVEPAVGEILAQWVELELHFQLAKTADNCYTANELHEIYKNTTLKSYLIFVHPHLQAVQRVNKLFQGSSTTDMSKLFREICCLIEETASVVVNKVTGFDYLSSDITDARFHMPNPNLGYEFETHIVELQNSGTVSAPELAEVRKNCIQFLINLVLSLRKRVPENINILRNIDQISVASALRHDKTTLVPILQELQYSPSAIGCIESQWNKLSLVKWAQENDTALFWAEVLNCKDAGGNNRFSDLAEFATRMLTMPFSNAEVERIFSQMNIVKSKLRNRMQCDMVNAIVFIRSWLSNSGKCCSDFEISREMVKEIGTTKIYDVDSDETLDIVDANLFN